MTSKFECGSMTLDMGFPGVPSFNLTAKKLSQYLVVQSSEQCFHFRSWFLLQLIPFYLVVQQYSGSGFENGSYSLE